MIGLIAKRILENDMLIATEKAATLKNSSPHIKIAPGAVVLRKNRLT